MTIIKSLPIKISSWSILFLCIVSSFFSLLLMDRYGSLHQPILESGYKLKNHIENISNDEAAKDSIRKNENLRKLTDDIPTIYEQIHQTGYQLVGNMLIYRVFAIISILSATMTCFFKPKWVWFIALPIGIYTFMMGGLS